MFFLVLGAPYGPQEREGWGEGGDLSGLGAPDGALKTVTPKNNKKCLFSGQMDPKNVCGSKTAAASSKNAVWMQHGCFLSLPGLKKLFGRRTAAVDKCGKRKNTQKSCLDAERQPFSKRCFLAAERLRFFRFLCKFLCRRPRRHPALIRRRTCAALAFKAIPLPPTPVSC